MALGPQVHLGTQGAGPCHRALGLAQPATCARFTPVPHTLTRGHVQIGLAADGATEDEAMKEHLDRSRDQYIAGAADIRCPCLIMRGRESDLVSADGVRDFLVAVPHAKFVDIADAHHMIAGDSNTVFGAELVSFLDSVYDAEGGAPVPVAGRLQPSRTAAGDSGEARGDRRGSVSDSSDSDSSDSDSDDNGARPFIIRARL